MTKNRSIKIAVLVLALALITSCFVGTTFAKYTSTVTGSDDVTVAKWAITLNDTDISTGNADFAFNLFTTIKDSAVEAGDEATTPEDEDVAAGKVAPGTKGEFALEVVNNSEVSASYAMSFTVTLPSGLDSNRFKFYSNEGMTTEITPVDGVYTVGGGNIKYDAEATPEEKTASKTVYWQWIYDVNTAGDTSDTTIGAYGEGTAPTITVTPTIVVTQID